MNSPNMRTKSIEQTVSSTLRQPRHGGDIENAAAHFGGHLNDWLDLSTGISPWAYPIPNIGESVWRELPASNADLMSAAASFYHCEESTLFPTPGSQLAIRLLPRLITPQTTVAIPKIGYQEHAYSWTQAGHVVERYSNLEQLSNLVSLKSVANAVVINPNNPTCELFDAQRLLSISDNLSGVLLVDEAFADLDDSQSLCRATNQAHNVIVLRSLGKFFGLAGARIGFVISQHPLATQLHELLSPWSINAAAVQVAEQALHDTVWQQMQRQRVTDQSQQLSALLDNCFDQSGFTRKGQGLFTTLSGTSKNIQTLHQQLAEKLIWTRLGDDYLDHCGQQRNWLRLSLPGNHFEKLTTALSTLTQQT